MQASVCVTSICHHQEVEAEKGGSDRQCTEPGYGTMGRDNGVTHDLGLPGFYSNFWGGDRAL